MFSRTLLLVALLIGASQIGTASAKEWWDNSFVYQIYPRSFKDSNGDGIGDLNGITSRLEHLADLGVSSFWISPIYRSPMVDFGYDITNFTDIDPVFGNFDDFAKLVAKAKSLGLKVMLDFVPNHTSNEHPWFNMSVRKIAPYDRYYVWVNATIVGDERRPPNNWLSTFGGSAWEWNAQRGQFYLHQFATGMPDLNYRYAGLENEMKAVLSFWLKRGVSGFRIDSINHMYEDSRLLDEPVKTGSNLPDDNYDRLDHLYTKNLNESYEMLKKWRDLCDSANSTGDKIILLTEAYAPTDLTIKYFKYGSDVPFNFMFMGEVNNLSRHVEYKRAIDNWFNNLPEGNSSNWVVGNHDQRRVTGRLGIKRADQLSMLATVLPGVGVIYNGDEIGMEDIFLTYNETLDPAGCNAGPNKYQMKSRDPQRSPFQWDDTVSAGFSTNNKTWLPVHPNYRTLNLAAQKKQQLSHYWIFKKLVQLKKHPMMVTAKTQLIPVDNTVLAVLRQLKDQIIVLLINCTKSNSLIDAKNWLNIPQNLTVYTASIGSNVTAGVDVDTTKLNVPGSASIILASRNMTLQLFEKLNIEM